MDGKLVSLSRLASAYHDLVAQLRELLLKLLIGAKEPHNLWDSVEQPQNREHHWSPFPIQENLMKNFLFTNQLSQFFFFFSSFKLYFHDIFMI